jgi:ADP-heptose:LPS heptosyltransferase/glycosyltransferase involved in cell wall biosynthesis
MEVQPPPIPTTPVTEIGSLVRAVEAERAGRYVEAWHEALEAIALRPFHPEAYIQMASTAVAAGDPEAALRAAQRALALTPKWPTAQQVVTALQRTLNAHRKQPKKANPIAWPALPDPSRKPRLSVCMIVKNEERFLGQCLASLKDIADELIVIDTGSTDRTVEIAREHGAQVGHFECCNDFAAARNASIAPATGDWILFLDADEELSPAEKQTLPALLNSDNVALIRLPLINTHQGQVSKSILPRLFRNIPAIQFQGCVHEGVYTSLLKVSKELQMEISVGDMLILHHGYTAEVISERNKVQHNNDILVKALEERPQAAYGYECYTISPQGQVGEAVVDSSAINENYIAVARQTPVLSSSDAALLPIHFFTIVLNGLPFIKHHIEVLRQLPFPWHWHIIEGVAELTHDTAWSTQFGGLIADHLHRNGLSNDGTREYLDSLAKGFPLNVTIHRKPDGQFWDGKLEMVNAPLAHLTEDCLLWQVDADELWTKEQITRARELFVAQPQKTAAFYYCHYFVGENLVITTRNTYGNNTGYEWIRTWRFSPGCRWTAHEPPQLCRPTGNGTLEDLAKVNPLNHADTEAAGLTFQHFAYATPEQLRFKETYYGYKGALSQWNKLQQQREFPVLLSQHFYWVKCAAKVNTAKSQNIDPLAKKDSFGQWKFASNAPWVEVQRVLFVRTDSIGDAVLASSMLPHLRRKFPYANFGVLCQDRVVELFTACPIVETVICFDRQKALADESYRKTIISEIAQFNPDLVLNSVYSSDALTELLTLSNRGPQIIGIAGDLSNTDEATRDQAARFYSRRIPSPGFSKCELERHRDFLIGLGLQVPRLEPVVWTSLEDEALAETFFRTNQLDSLRTIAVFPGAQHDCRVYGGYSAALREISGFDFLIFGTEADEPLANKLINHLPGRVFNLCGRSSLRETAALLRRCRLYVGAESSGAHLACAVGVPNVVLLGGGHFGRFMPYSRLTSAVVLPLDCFGCNWRCHHARAHCVKDVAADVLAEAIRETLAEGSSKPRVFLQPMASWPRVEPFPVWTSPAVWLRESNLEVTVLDCIVKLEAISLEAASVAPVVTAVVAP